MNDCFRLFQLPQCDRSPAGFQDRQLDHLAQETTSMQGYQLERAYVTKALFLLK